MKPLFLQQWIPDDVFAALGWTFVHSLWQGLVAAVAAALIISCTRRSPAKVRYNLMSLVLFLFLLASIFTFFTQLNNSAKVGEASAIASGNTRSFLSDASLSIQAEPTWTDGFVNWFNTNAHLFVLAWSFFFIIHCLKLFTGLASVYRLRHHRIHAPSEEWKERMQKLADRLGIKRQAMLLQSELVKMPVAVGYLKPVVLLPLGLLAQLPPDQLETILLHELAHIRRRDYLVNLGQRFAEAIFFFNPGLLWISSLIREERESCCDDIVIANTTHKKVYLDALISFQEYSFTSSAPAMAISSRKYFLLNRVHRILTLENKRLNLAEKLVLVSGLLIFSAFTVLSKKEKVLPILRSAISEMSVPGQPDQNPYTASPTVAKQVEGDTRNTMNEQRTGKLIDTIPPKRLDTLRTRISHKVKKRANNLDSSSMIAKEESPRKSILIVQSKIQNEKRRLQKEQESIDKEREHIRLEAENMRRETMTKNKPRLKIDKSAWSRKFSANRITKPRKADATNGIKVDSIKVRPGYGVSQVIAINRQKALDKKEDNESNNNLRSNADAGSREKDGKNLFLETKSGQKLIHKSSGTISSQTIFEKRENNDEKKDKNISPAKPVTKKPARSVEPRKIVRI